MTASWCPSIIQLSIYHVCVLPGTKEDCEKAALELSFSQDVSGKGKIVKSTTCAEQELKGTLSQYFQIGTEFLNMNQNCLSSTVVKNEFTVSFYSCTRLHHDWFPNIIQALVATIWSWWNQNKKVNCCFMCTTKALRQKVYIILYYYMCNEQSAQMSLWIESILKNSGPSWNLPLPSCSKPD